MDFSNRQNRLVRLSEVPESYLEKIHAMAQNDPFYPTYHLAPKHGLMNDPNGLSYLMASTISSISGSH
ncbi:sucrose-6-phosphate hydrolase [Vibrio sp. JCM 19236]|nr:sucrose-6-phosphate hydrolase [Vibrio sp. JCM 19236]